MCPQHLRVVLLRIEPIGNFYRELLGWTGAMRLLLSGVAVSLLQLAGLALIYPFLKLVTDPEFFSRLISILEGMPFQRLLLNHKNSVLLIGLLLVGVFVLIGFFTACLVRIQANMAAEINIRISSELVADALKSRYQLFLEQSPVKIAGVSYSHTMHVSLLFQSVATAINELLLLGLLLVGLVLASPIAFFGFGVLVFTLYLIHFRPTSRRVAAIGRRAQAVELGRHRFVFVMASAIRDIKIMGLEEFFIRRNQDLATQHSSLATEYSIISTLQRLTIEVVLFCGVVFAAVCFSLRGGDLNYMVPAIAALGMGVIRSAPALSRLAGAYNSFRYSLPIVEELMELQHQLAHYPQKREAQAATFPGEYRANGLYFSYGEHQVLTNCSISITQGEVIALVGPSGSGKSTLLDLLAGLQPPSEGSFLLGGKAFSPFLSDSFPGRVGYVPQAIALLDDSIAFNIALEESPDPARLQRSLQRANLKDFVNSLPLGLQTQLGDGGQGLSGGQRQRLGIARALYREPALLILDEVTSALDESTARSVMAELLSMRGQVSLLFVTHDLRLVPADRIYRLDHGRIFEQT